VVKSNLKAFCLKIHQGFQKTQQTYKNSRILALAKFSGLTKMFFGNLVTSEKTYLAAEAKRRVKDTSEGSSRAVTFIGHLIEIDVA